MPDRSWYVLAGVGAAVGCLMVVAGLFFTDPSAGGPPFSPGLVALGSMFALQFAAELLPKGRRVAAGFLRIGAIAVAVVSLASILVL